MAQLGRNPAHVLIENEDGNWSEKIMRIKERAGNNNRITMKGTK